jgi:hypothetical protein
MMMVSLACVLGGVGIMRRTSIEAKVDISTAGEEKSIHTASESERTKIMSGRIDQVLENGKK